MTARDSALTAIACAAQVAIENLDAGKLTESAALEFVRESLREHAVAAFGTALMTGGKERASG